LEQNACLGLMLAPYGYVLENGESALQGETADGPEALRKSRMMPHLLCCQGLAIPKYRFALTPWICSILGFGSTWVNPVNLFKYMLQFTAI
jgi:hypothetical protein